MADGQPSLEQALAKLEGNIGVAVKAVRAALGSLKKLGAAAHVGDLREIRRTREVADQSMAALQQQLANLREGWDFDEEAYLGGSAFVEEVRDTAREAGLRIYEQDGQLYCYPFLVRVLPGERSVLIDKVRERRLRPSVLVAQLRDVQNKPARFKAEAFLETLYRAYNHLVPTGDGDLVTTRRVVPLVEVYELLTLLPGLGRDYTKSEFARDVYLLDESGLTATKNGQAMKLSASTGTRTASKVLSTITQEGREKKYYGISFSSAEVTDAHGSPRMA
jgi:hypothetical protein